MLKKLAGDELNKALVQASQHSNEQDENESDDSDDTDELAQNETIESIAAECMMNIAMRVKGNTDLAIALQQGNQLISKRKHVMISYSWAARKDIVLQIVNALKKTNELEIWFDEDHLLPGTRLKRAMLDAVEGSVIVIVFYSLPYFRSKNCQIEYKHAAKLHRPIIPILVHLKANQENEKAPVINDESKCKEYQDWLDKERKETNEERIYQETPADDKQLLSGNDLDRLVAGTQNAFKEEIAKMQLTPSDIPVENWDRLQVDKWLEGKSLDDLCEFRIYFYFK